MDNRNMINRVFSQKILHQIAIKIKVMLLMRHMIFFIYRDLKISM